MLPRRGLVWRSWRSQPSKDLRPKQDALFREREDALLFRTLATLRTDIDLFADVDELRFNGPIPAFAPLAAR